MRTWHSPWSMGGLMRRPAAKGAARSTASPFQQQLARNGRPAGARVYSSSSSNGEGFSSW